MSNVDLILGSNNKFDIFEYLENGNETGDISPKIHLDDGGDFCAPAAGLFFGRTRAFLKIQDGCDSFCTYCAVPLARGRSRSASVQSVVDRATSLVERGYKEIVLTGVHVGRYGDGLEPRVDLAGLLNNLDQIDGIERIRLSSLEPKEITDELIQVILSSQKVCPHWHVPLQSGDNSVLRRMGRNYNSSEYQNIVDKLVTVFPNAGLGTDVIVGFPGETPAQFQNTVDFLQRNPFTYFHVFKYSSRPNTTAAKLPDDVSAGEKLERSKILRELGQLKKNDFYSRQVGRRLQVLFESKKNGFTTGWSDNYVRVGVRSSQNLSNELKFVQVKKTRNNLVVGTIG